VSQAGGALHVPAVLADESAAVGLALGRVVRECWGAAEQGVAATIRYALEPRGKRLRPVLCVAAYRAILGGEGGSGIYDVACSLELIHTYSLVHDDLPCMDDDALRRGRPTAHRVFGSARATVAGAAMIPAAFLVLDRGATALGVEPRQRADMANVLARAAGVGGMVGGQVMDLDAERSRPDVARLEAIHRRKTGALFVGAAQLGGLAAGASPETVRALGAYGGSLGLAFQVADDILDETGAASITGKDAGRDRALGKATFPALLGLEGAKDRARAVAAESVAALERAGVHDEMLLALARFAVERDR
jgi:geranylgeranyl diphosphate synthase type II